MSELRSRKLSSRKKDETPRKKTHTSQAKDDSMEGILAVVSVAVGIMCMVAMGYVHANYMTTLHENWLWFSNIKVFFLPSPFYYRRARKFLKLSLPQHQKDE